MIVKHSSTAGGRRLRGAGCPLGLRRKEAEAGKNGKQDKGTVSPRSTSDCLHIFLSGVVKLRVETVDLASVGLPEMFRQCLTLALRQAALEP